MKTKLITIALVAVFMTLAVAGFSQTATPVIRHRQAHQQKRIANGVKSGELTARESARLETREAKIQKDKKTAKSDGVVTQAERRRLRHEENRSSRAIYRQKHDAQGRK